MDILPSSAERAYGVVVANYDVSGVVLSLYSLDPIEPLSEPHFIAETTSSSDGSFEFELPFPGIFLVMIGGESCTKGDSVTVHRDAVFPLELERGLWPIECPPFEKNQRGGPDPILWTGDRSGDKLGHSPNRSGTPITPHMIGVTRRT